MRSLPETSSSIDHSPAPNETDSQAEKLGISLADDLSGTSTVVIPVSTSTSPSSHPVTVSPEQFPTHSQYPNSLQIKSEPNSPISSPKEVFTGLCPPKSPQNIDTNNFYDDVTYSPSFIAHPSSIKRNPSIYINPTILLSKQRANYPGPGTPMPLLSPSAYPYPYWDHSTNNNIPRHLERSRRSRRRSRIEKTDTSKRERQVVKIPAKDDKPNVTKNVKHSDFYSRGVDNTSGRCRDARDWLNEKAARGISHKTPRFVDRGTSPINFSPEVQKEPESRDIALSPIRCIEPLEGCKSSVNIKPSGSKLSCERSSLDEGNSVKSEIIKLLKHCCERCEVEGYREETMGCSACQDHAAQEVVH